MLRYQRHVVACAGRPFGRRGPCGGTLAWRWLLGTLPFLTPALVGNGWTGETVWHEVRTHRGTVEIVRDETPAGTVFRVRHEGKPILDATEYDSVAFHLTYPEPPAARLVLLSLITGRNNCPNLYALIEMPERGEPRLTQEFGNCSPFATVRWLGHGLRIDIPRIGRAAAQSWVYAAGKLRRIRARPKPPSQQEPAR